MLELTQPVITSQGWVGEVIMVDIFGNLSTNLRGDFFKNDFGEIVVTIKGKRIHGLTVTFGNAKEGALITTIDSSGYLSISVVNGDASKALDADIGDQVQVTLPAKIG